MVFVCILRRNRLMLVSENKELNDRFCLLESLSISLRARKLSWLWETEPLTCTSFDRDGKSGSILKVAF